MGNGQGTVADRVTTHPLPDPAFWRGRRVFLTGHTGFKGAWLALWLARLGAAVTGFALAPERPSFAEDAGVERRVFSVRGDVRDRLALGHAMAAAAPDIVLHLAAQALVRRSYREPVETFAVNVMGTAHVLEAAGALDCVRAVLCVSSDKCYDHSDEAVAHREHDALGGSDPYSASKAAGEMLVASWRRSFCAPAGAGGRHVAVATARAGNVIGGGDWGEDRLVPDCIRSFAAGQSVAIRNPHAIRPWQYVLDPLRGYLLLAEKLFGHGPDFARAWNFGPQAGESQNVSRLVTRLARAWGDGAWHVAGGTHPHEAGLLALDSSLAFEKLGWRPRIGLDTALDWTGDFYCQLAGGANAAALAEAEFGRYCGADE